MALTAAQRRVVQRNDLGGDALLALLDKDYVVARDYNGTIAASALITAAPLSAVLTDVVRLIFIPRGAVYINLAGVAAATTRLIPLGGLNIPVTAALAATIQLFAANIECDLYVCTPRN